MVSCGPSLEEKARKIALRDSASIDSALKKEEAAKRAIFRHQKQLKDSVRKLAQDSSRHKADSLKVEALNLKDSIKKFPGKPTDTNHRHKHFFLDTSRHRKIDSLRASKGHLLGKKNTIPTHPGSDSALFYGEKRLHKRNAADSPHRKKPKKSIPTTDTSKN